MSSDKVGQRPPRPTHMITWTALLGRWVEFARSAVGLPDDAPGRAMRDSIADIIALQAVFFSLGEIAELPRDEQHLGLDRAEILIDKHASAILNRWGDSLPSKLSEIIDDAREAHQKAVVVVQNISGDHHTSETGSGPVE